MAVGYWPRGPSSMVWRAGVWAVCAVAMLLYGLVFAWSPPVAVSLWLAAVLGWHAVRRLEWTALGLFLIVPLGRLTWLNETGTLDLTKLFVGALAVAWAARALLRKDRDLAAVWTESPVTVLILVFLLVNFLSLLNAYDLPRSALSLMRLSALFGMYILILALVQRRRQVEVAIGFLVLTGLAVCLLGVWESRTHEYLWHILGQDRSLPPGLASSEGGGPFALRIITVFIDYNFMGGYMAVLFGIVGGCALAIRRWYVRLALVPLAGLIIYNVIHTGSRGGVMGLSVTMLVLLVLSRIRIRWFVLALIVIGAIAVFPVADQFVPQFRGGISLEDLKQDQRWGYWQMAFRMMQDHPIIGVGTDNFPSLYSWYRVSPALMSPYYCHNIYVQMWAEGGIFGLISLLTLVIAVGVSYVKALRGAGDEQWRGIVAGLLAAFLGYAVFSSTCNTLHDQPFWMLMALSVVALRVTRDEGTRATLHSTAGPASPDEEQPPRAAA